MSKSKSSWQTGPTDVVLLVGVLTVAAVIVWPRLFLDWIPWDDGTMALAADWVQQGRMPHRDFLDPWTGGWTYLQAACFRLFGASLRMVRIPLYVAWLLGTGGMYIVSRRFLSPWTSAFLALAGATWSLFAWHIPSPNWLYTPLAVAIVWCALQFVSSDRLAWLVFVGLAVGVALLIKISGLYLLAGVGIWLLDDAGSRGAAERKPWPMRFAWLTGVAMAVFTIAVERLVHRMPAEYRGAAQLHYVAPSLCLGCWITYRAWRHNAQLWTGLSRLVQTATPLALGIAVALLPFLLLYAQSHALSDLYAGVFVRPAVRLGTGIFGAPGRVFTVVAAFPLAVMMFSAPYAAADRTAHRSWLVLALGLAWGAIAYADTSGARDAQILMVRSLPLVLPIAAFWTDWRTPLHGAPARLIVLLIALAETSQLLQVPGAFLAYFHYVAPLAILAFAAIATQWPPAGRQVVPFFTAFLLVSGGFPGFPDADLRSWHQLPGSRAGLSVSFLDSARVAQLADFMQHRPAGALMVLGDAPEVPFLLKRPSANTWFFDALADSSALDSAQFVSAMERADAQTLVIRHRAIVLTDRTTVLAASMRGVFPENRRFGPYEVRWRSSGARRSVPAAESPRARPEPK